MKLIVDIKKKLPGFSLEVAFSLEDGISSLFGPSGSGKSLTLRTIAGIIDPDEGYIALNGNVLFDSKRKISVPPEKRNIGYLFQNYALFPTMKVEKNLSLGAKKEKDKKKRKLEVQNMAELLSISHLLDKYPFELSGGEAQRVAIGRMLLSKPDFLLFDEPFSALDESLKIKIEPEFARIVKESGKSGLLVTHSKREAMHLSKHLFLISGGQIEKEGDLPDIYWNPGTKNAAELFGHQNILTIENGQIAALARKQEKTGKSKYILVHSFKETEEEANVIVLSSLPDENGFLHNIQSLIDSTTFTYNRRERAEDGTKLSLIPNEYSFLEF